MADSKPGGTSIRVDRVAMPWELLGIPQEDWLETGIDHGSRGQEALLVNALVEERMQRAHDQLVSRIAGECLGREIESRRTAQKEAEARVQVLVKRERRAVAAYYKKDENVLRAMMSSFAHPGVNSAPPEGYSSPDDTAVVVDGHMQGHSEHFSRSAVEAGKLPAHNGPAGPVYDSTCTDCDTRSVGAVPAHTTDCPRVVASAAEAENLCGLCREQIAPFESWFRCLTCEKPICNMCAVFSKEFHPSCVSCRKKAR